MSQPDPRSSPHWPAMLAALDRIIPADEFPSATQVGVDRFVATIFTRELADRWADFEKGLAILDAAASEAEGVAFHALDPSQQDEFLQAVESDAFPGDWAVPSPRWFRLLCDLAAEGYYGDPGNGGNRDIASWKMVGYDPGFGGTRW